MGWSAVVEAFPTQATAYSRDRPSASRFRGRAQRPPSAPLLSPCSPRGRKASFHSHAIGLVHAAQPRVYCSFVLHVYCPLCCRRLTLASSRMYTTLLHAGSVLHIKSRSPPDNHSAVSIYSVFGSSLSLQVSMLTRPRSVCVPRVSLF